MALGCACRRAIRPGDAVFDTREHEPGYPVHVGVYLDEPTTLPDPAEVEVQGLPAQPGGKVIGTATWGGAPGRYQPDLVGQRLNEDPIAVADVAILARLMEREASLLGKTIRWKRKRRLEETILVRDGVPLFLQGTCAHYVDYLYERVGLRLVDEKLRDPHDSERIHPTTQMRAFQRDEYPLTGIWEDRFAEWPLSLP